MAQLSLTTLFVLAGGIAIFIYWFIGEYFTSDAKQEHSQHPRLVQFLIRLLMPVAFALGLFQLLNFFVFPLPLPSAVRETAHVLGLGLFWAGALLAVWARGSLGKNWAHAADYQVFAEQQLVQSGAYAYIRHPIYLAFLLMFIGVELFVGSWLVLLAIPLAWHFNWQAKKEEVLLTEKFGGAYRDYRTKTKMFLPVIY